MAAQNDYKSQAYAPSVEQQKQNYDQQQQFIQQMQQQASGVGPSPAKEFLKNAVQQQTSQANALAASQQGNINAGLATRNAQQMAGQAAQQAAGQGANMQLQTQQMLGNQINATGQMGAQQQQFGDQLNANIKQQNVEAQNSLINKVTGGLIGAGGSAASAAIMSDERVKKDIRPGEDDIKQFLDALSSHSYKYKDPSQPGTSPGEHTGVMAQELEKSKVGSQMVMDTPNGKMVDYAKGLPAILAAQAELNKRLDRVEGKGANRMAEGGEVDAKAIGLSAAKGFAEGFTGQEIKTPEMAKPAVANPMVGQPAPAGPNLGLDYQMLQTPVMGSSFAAQTLQKMNMGGMAKRPLTTPQIVAQHGAIVPGRAKVHGDSEKNDIVDAKLSPGEIVIPRTVVNSKDAPEAAKRFVAAILAKKGKK